jgi:glyoxylase-like metal-dependent hydrolase (beta-lactamase superfamily II)
MPNPAIEVVPTVWRIPTVGRSAVNSYAVVEQDGSVTLIDCGLKSAPAKIVAGLEHMGKRVSDVNRIVLTHMHRDHAGGAAEMAAQTGAQVAAHADDAPYGTRGLAPELDQTHLLGRLFNRAPAKFKPFEVGNPLLNGQLLDVGGGLRVIHTPGHSPGHISLLHEPTKLLITGDAIFNVLGLRYSLKTFCTDFRLSRQTAHLLGELDYDVAAFTHGPEIKESPREKIRAFLRRGQAT